MANPSDLKPGAVLRYRNFPDRQVVSRRKEDDTGWWLTDGSGLSDKSAASDDWTVVARRADQDRGYLHEARHVISDAIALAIGDDQFDPAGVADWVLDALAETGWHLLNYEDAEKMLNAYVLQQVR